MCVQSKPLAGSLSFTRPGAHSLHNVQIRPTRLFCHPKRRRVFSFHSNAIDAAGLFIITALGQHKINATHVVYQRNNKAHTQREEKRAAFWMAVFVCEFIIAPFLQLPGALTQTNRVSVHTRPTRSVYAIITQHTKNIEPAAMDRRLSWLGHINTDTVSGKMHKRVWMGFELINYTARSWIFCFFESTV
jgi:hypothetical protein